MAEIKFEAKLKRLQEIVEKLESEDCDLDESIKLYEDGLKLSKELNQILNKYDEKLEKIQKENTDEQ